MRVSFLLILLNMGTSLLANDSSAHYFIEFKNKNNSLYSTDKPWEFLSVKAIDRRYKFGINIDEQDLPVNIDYVQTIDFLRGTKIVKASKWLNGIEVILDDHASLEDIKQQSFVKQVVFLGNIPKRIKNEPEEIDEAYYTKAKLLKDVKTLYKDSIFSYSQYNRSLDQLKMIGLPDLHQRHLMGQGISIAVLDAGFNNAYKVNGMEDILDSKVIIKDFVDDDNSVWEDDAHGTKVLSFMKTFNPNNYIGSAPFADYILLRTEIGSQEYPLEELKWVFAAEYADSLGVDMIIGSLGYHTFDDAKLNHQYSEFDGKSTLAARGANKANASGIAVVCSAGNEGQGKWRKISTPADADGVFAIGAIKEDGNRASFSSEGINDGRIKPDFMAPGQRVTIATHNGFYPGNGTSYATPIFAGALACLMQAYPYWTPDSLKSGIKLCCTHYLHKDTLMGNGIPDMDQTYVRLSNMVFKYDYTPTASTLIVPRYTTVILKSSIQQKVKITVLYQDKKRFKKLSSKTYHLEKGEWLRDEQWLDLILAQTERKDKRDMLKCLLEIHTDNGSTQRIFVSKPN